MASRKTTASKTSSKPIPRTKQEKLVIKVRDQLKELLERHEAGKLNQLELKARLDKVKETLDVMEPPMTDDGWP